MSVNPSIRRRDDPAMRTAEFAAYTSEVPPVESAPPGRAPLTWRRGVAWVALGGAIGGLLRLAFITAFPATTTLTLVDLPWATLISNILGCLVIGGLTGLREARPGLRSDIHLAVGTGFCGALTTLSTFILEIGVMLGGRYPFEALQYVLFTLVACTFVMLAGFIVMRAAFTASRQGPDPVDQDEPGESEASGRDEEARP